MTKRQQKKWREELEARVKNRTTPELPVEDSPLARKFREDLRRKASQLALPVKELRPMTAEEQYRQKVGIICRIYEAYARKDFITMSPSEREMYRYDMDQVRWIRGALESDLPVEQKLAELRDRLTNPQG